MSTREKQIPATGCQDGAGGWVGQNPGPIWGSMAPAQGAAGVVGAAAFLASQAVSRALLEEEFGEETSFAFDEEDRDVRLAEQEEGEVEEEEEEEEAVEDQEEDDVEEDDLEDDQEIGEEEEEEEEGSEDEEEDDYEGSEVVTSVREFPLVRFQSLFWDLVRSLLCRFFYNVHIHVQPHESPFVLRSCPREMEDPGEGPAPRESVYQEDKGEARDGVDLAEPKESEEGAVAQEAEAPAAEYKDLEGEALNVNAESQELGACAPEGTDAVKLRQHPHTLIFSVGTAGSHAGYAQLLPQVVKRRVDALKKLQAKYAQIEAQFYKDLYNLEKRYAALYQPLFDKRSDIINAIYEPTEDECHWEVGVQEGAWEEMERKPEGKAQTKGIPHFWLTTFKNVKILSNLIQENDELILEYLKDVKIKYSGIEEPVSFTLEFVFESNEYFFNEVLTKTYRMQSDTDDSGLFSQGPEIISSTGCEIYWKEGVNVTGKTIKLHKYEDHGSVVSTNRKVPSYSFFTYFYPPDFPEGRVVDAATDYKLGYLFRELLVPKAVLFFTKEAGKYEYENSDGDGQTFGGEEEKEEDEIEEPEEGIEKDLDPGEGTSRETSWKA